MERASWVLKRQSMVALAVLRRMWYASMALANATSSPWRPRRQSRDNTLNSISAMLSQLACLGVWWNSRRFTMAAGFGGGRGLVERIHAVDVQVVENDAYHGSVGIGCVHQPLHLVGEVSHGAAFGDGDMTPARQRLTGQEDVAGASAAILVVLTPRSPQVEEAAVPARRPVRPRRRWRSRQSTPPDGWRRRARRRGPARPPWRLQTPRLLWGCTTAACARA